MGRPTSDINDTFAFDKVLFFGRTLSEYGQMFNLDAAQVSGLRILDCPSGPASFVAECHRKGIKSVGCDPLYEKTAEELAALIETMRTETLDRQARVQHLFDKDKPTMDYRNAKFEAFEHFRSDYSAGLAQGRYINAALPTLPFPDRSFDLALSSNFLFLYSDYDEGGMLIDSPFDYEFHLRSLLELMRVAKEARIYPIKGPHKDEHDYADRIIADLNKKSFQTQRVSVPYRDVKGAHHMLRVIAQ